MQPTLFVGVDVHRQQNVFCVMDQDGQELSERFSFDNNRPGTQELVGRLAHLMQEGDYEQLQLGAEATGLYWLHFCMTLSQDPMLNQWPLTLYAVNPRLTANYKRSFSDLDKTDDIDAFVVADRLRMGRGLPHPFVYDERYLPLRFLTRYRYHLVHNLAREKAYCLAMLYLKASEYTRRDVKPFSDVFGAASRAVLQEFASLEEIAALPFDDLVEVIDVKGKRRFPDPTDNARRLQQVALDSYSLPEPFHAPIQLVLNMSLSTLPTWSDSKNGSTPPLRNRWLRFPRPWTRFRASALSSWLVSWLKSVISHVFSSTKPRSPSTLASNGAKANPPISSPMKRRWLAPAIASFVTTSVRPPTSPECTMLTTEPTMTASSVKSASTLINGPWFSPPASWSGWSFGC